MFVSLFIGALLVSFLLTFVARKILLTFGLVDAPKLKRKIHTKPIALGGGIAIYLTFFLFVSIAYAGMDALGSISAGHLIATAIGGGIIMIGGFIDDKYGLSPRYQLLFPVCAALIVIAAGIGPESIGLPNGHIANLTDFSVWIPYIGNWFYLIDLITLMWLMTMSYSTKLLDGLDGLVSGIVGIGACMIFFLTQQPLWYQPEVSVLAIILAGACVGFLMWNFHPAVIFLGEGGSLLLGYLLGVLAIISGSKMATALLVMAIPVFDIVGVMVKRIARKTPITQGGTDHLHFELLAFGLSHRSVVLILYGVSIFFGVSTLFLKPYQKMVVLGMLAIVLFSASMYLGFKNNTNRQ